jgi:hypothetical protein
LEELATLALWKAISSEPVVEMLMTSQEMSWGSR